MRSKLKTLYILPKSLIYVKQILEIIHRFMNYVILTASYI